MDLARPENRMALRAFIETLEGTKGERLTCVMAAAVLELEVDGKTFRAACEAAVKVVMDYVKQGRGPEMTVN